MEVIAASVKKIAEAGLIDQEFSVVWHAGEPLAAGIKFYRAAHEVIKENLPEGIRFKHCIQTNGTLITKEWCDLFKELDIQIGVSVDGPAFINDAFRLDKTGKGSLAKVLEGVARLKENGIRFHTISVVTKDAVKYPEEIFRFLHSLGPDDIAFNVEEIEGVHTESSLNSVTNEEFSHFMQTIHSLSFEVGEPGFVREIRNAHHAVMGSLMNLPFMLPMESNPLSIINVDVKGNFSTFSPELLGMKHDLYEDFVFGNFLESGIAELQNSSKFKEISEQILKGVELCHQTCEYFHFCGGGSPSNKLFENGSFNSAETMHCRMTKKVVTDLVLERMESMIAKDISPEYAEILAP